MARPTVYLKVEGMEAIRAALRAIPDRALHPKILTDALMAGARPIRDDARRRAPKGRGVVKQVRVRRGGVSGFVGRRKHLSDGIAAVRGGSVRSRDTANVYVVARAPHSHLVEFGTAPHRIAPKEAKVLALGGRGFAGGAVQHPGAVAKPFLRPAWDAGAPNVVPLAASVIEKSIARVLKAEVRSRARRAARLAS